MRGFGNSNTRDNCDRYEKLNSKDITEQHALDSLREKLLKNIPGGVILYRVRDGIFKLLMFNDALANVLGCDGLADEFDPEAVLHEFIHPDDRSAMREYFKKCLEQPGGNFECRYRIWSQTKGAYIWIETRSNVVRGEDELLVYATFSDITDANRAQDELRNSRHALNAITKYGNLGVWSYDLDARQIRQEYSDHEAYGYVSAAENIPDSYIEQGVIHPEDAEAYRACYQRILDGDGISDCTVRVYDRNLEKYLWMHISLVRQDDIPGGRRIAVGFSVVVDQEIRSIRQLEQTQERLKQSQKTLEAACAFAGMWVFTVDVETRTVYTNEKLQREFGFLAEAEDFPECAIARRLILPEYEDLYREAFQKLYSGANEVVVDVQARLPDGEVHWVRFKAQRLDPELAGGKIMAVSAQVIDTEKVMQARLRLERQKQQHSDTNLLFYFVANISQNVIVEHRESAGAETVEPDSLVMDEFIKEGYSRLTYEADRKRAAEIYERRRLLSNYKEGILQEEYIAYMQLKDGIVCRSRHLMQLLKDPVTNDILLYEYVYDISGEQIMDVLMKLELYNEYAAFGLLIVAVDQFTVWSFDERRDKPIIVVLPFSEYMRDYVESFVHPDDRERFLAHYLRPDYSSVPCGNSEIVYRAVINGTIRYCKGTLYIYEEDGKRFCLLTRRDYTEIVREEEQERQRLAEALEQAEKADKAKSEFLSRMSHDMRTPMNAILGMTRLAADEVGDRPTAARYIDQINQSSQYLLGIINDILDMSRIDSGKSFLNPAWHTPAEITLPVIYMIAPAMETKGIRFVYDRTAFERINLEFYVDMQKTQQLLVNLLNNACKFTPEGGTVTLRFRNVSLDRDACLCTDEIIIEDTGCGMSEEFLGRVFIPFEQERLPGTDSIPGTGLGLSIARSIARQMGGDITVQSKLGKGSAFTVTYPYRYRIPESAAKPPEDSSAYDPELLRGKHVLLAEDNSINAEIAAILLKKAGMSVELARNGSQAVELFSAAAEGTYDLILMDIRMPVLDGLEASRRIRDMDRRDAKTVPIVAMSANAYEEDRQMSLAAGMNDHLSKPVEPGLLYHTIQNHIAAASRRSE
ncbi:MAG: response regulator [Bacillota bacterium]|nr:response regulator [Bacillota bacterium]